MFGLILAKPRKVEKFHFRLTLLQPLRRMHVQLLVFYDRSKKKIR